GAANYFVPLMIGARDMAFPRLNALSYWLLLFGALLLNWSFLAGSPPDVGWFAYSPLTEQPFSLGTAPDYWALGLLVTGAGSTATSAATSSTRALAPTSSSGSTSSGSSATRRSTSWRCRRSG